MQWSDETVERIANIVGRQIPSAYRTVATQAILSSLTLADLMQVAEVRELVEAAQRKIEDDARIARERETAAEAERKLAAEREAALIAQAERDRDMAAQAAQKALQEAEARQEAALSALEEIGAVKVRV